MGETKAAPGPATYGENGKEQKMRRSNVALRLQTSLLEEARRVANSEGVALNQLINVAVAESCPHYAPRTTSRSDPGEASSIRRSVFSDQPAVVNLPLPVISDK